MKKALIISLFLNACFIGFFVWKRQQNKWTEAVKKENQARLKSFDDFPIKPGDIVFFGNSITEMCPHEMVCNYKNRGIKLNKISDLIERVGQITKGNPQKIFIEIGINDIREGNDIGTIKKEFVKLVDLIKQQSPNSRLFIQSISPTGANRPDYHEAICQVNSFYREYCTSHDLTYIDLYNPMLGVNNKIDTSYSYDGLHFTTKGYKQWLKQVRPFL